MYQRVVATLGLAWAVCNTSHAELLQLRILETTDLHMNLLSYDYYQDKPTDQYGLARAISLIKAARAETTNSLLFDNGDLLQGNPLGDVVARVSPLQKGQTHPAYKVMNPLGYDAANLGNHEFNYGLDFLRRSIAGASFPYVNANVLLADGKQDSTKPTHAFVPYVLLDRTFKDASGKEQKLRVGVIGFVPPQIMQWDKANLEGQVVTRDMVDMARLYVPEMRAKGAQLVVAIPHSGFEKGEVGAFAENAVSRLAEVPGVDAILFGHAHAEFPGKAFASYPKVDIERGTINGVPAVMPGRWGDHLGVIDLTLDNSSGQWKVVNSQASIRPIFDRAAKKSLAAEDPMVMQAIRAEHERTLEYVRNKVAVSDAPIYSYFAQVADDPSIQIVSNAQIAYVKRAMQGTDYEKYPVLSAAAPFKAGGRQGWNYYTDIPAGPLAIKHMADLYIYPNTLKAVLLTGAQVREWLEMSAGQFLRIDPQGPARQPLINDAFPSYNFDVIDGVQYEVDVTQSARYDSKGQLANPQAHRIRNLRFEGHPIDDKARFVVATNNYRAFGGGNFPALGADKVVLDAPDENRQALVEYLRMSDKLSASHSVNPSADGNWRIAPIEKVHPTFLSGSAGAQFLGKHPSIRLVQDNGDGSSLYELVD
ncbi:bifunctional 2',3'-cyclic-nucleotide 2'-phosphodiesterase/3'-nucleotidase [Curvibacter sp. CHRR-16]|uniref:bifunctional 2',3'-cyclic-nucleotide 2'-phosphodiesterase/3'-nucleotidase n=1 Tax=Curvibacter sp. CHRR-16 TaxID=2835872 RepID=UPI001BD9F848|nr:bifunctional 2',3'-cyclic-nucleotide 2'-phosphodiesterase/3'-nucleotidase [Curvibacter sp. CHRR-16]MBT0569914.1 bifunctional 2',3'-cyclic-nucleotide 2'-phosphodiesterase/3'-nucleotidase [Curvibacter sp. CHRR-16]